jgi:hypothetical protein
VVVNREGTVCAVAYSGRYRDSQWLLMTTSRRGRTKPRRPKTRAIHLKPMRAPFGDGSQEQQMTKILEFVVLGVVERSRK